MSDNYTIVQIVLSGIDELNEQREEEDRLEKDLDAPLFGESGPLDSLGLVNLIVHLEESIEGQFGQTIMLVDQSAKTGENNPFRNIRALTLHISSVLGVE